MGRLSTTECTYLPTLPTHLDLLPRTHTGVPEQRAQRNRKEAAPHMTLP